MYEKPIASIARDTHSIDNVLTLVPGTEIDSRVIVGRVNHQGKLSFYTGAEGPGVGQRDRWDETPSKAKEYTDGAASTLIEAVASISKFISKKDTLVIVRSALTVTTTISDVTPADLIKTLTTAKKIATRKRAVG